MDKKKALWSLILAVSRADGEVDYDHLVDIKPDIKGEIDKIILSKDVNRLIKLFENYDVGNLKKDCHLKEMTMKDYVEAIGTYILNN